MMTWEMGSLGWLWMFAGLVLIVGVVLIVGWAVQRAGGGPEDDAMTALRHRFARGEIDAGQFEEIRRVLGSTERPRGRDRAGLIGLLLVVGALLALILGSTLAPASWNWGWGGAGPRMMGGGDTSDQAGPGSSGFVAGTASAPRLVRILAGPGYAFSPSEIRVDAGETITFAVTTMGPMVHEFKVGPAAEVAADATAAPEIADIGMMATKSLTYTFSGSGPFAFACHEPGHYEAGMRGTITVVT